MERQEPLPLRFPFGGQNIPAHPLARWLTRGDGREAAGKGKSSFRSSCPVGVPGWGAYRPCRRPDSALTEWLPQMPLTACKGNSQMPHVTQFISASCSGLGCFAGSCPLCLGDLSSLLSKARAVPQGEPERLRLEVTGDPVFLSDSQKSPDIRAGGQSEVISDVCARRRKGARRIARIPGVHAGGSRPPAAFPPFLSPACGREVVCDGPGFLSSLVSRSRLQARTGKSRLSFAWGPVAEGGENTWRPSPLLLMGWGVGRSRGSGWRGGWWSAHPKVVLGAGPTLLLLQVFRSGIWVFGLFVSFLSEFAPIAARGYF